jgi:hypothetical protein
MKKGYILIMAAFLLLLFSCRQKTSNPTGPAAQNTATITVTGTVKNTPSFTMTATASATDTPAETSAATPISSPVDTMADTDTPTPTVTETITETQTEQETFTQTFTQTCTVTPSSTPTQTATDSLPPYSFESDLQGWSLDTSLAGYTALTWNNDPAYAALSTTGSAQVACNFVPTSGQGAVRVSFTNPQNLTGKTITGYIYVPADLAALSNKYQAQIGIYTTAWQNSALTLLNTAGWIQLNYTPSGVGEASVTAVRFWTKKNNASTPSWAGTIYFDEISW